MRPIITNLMTLLQYQQHLDSAQIQAPSSCPYCGYANLWHHGHYERKSDREHTGDNLLNPVLICRFYCCQCHRTCSVLPECIFSTSVVFMACAASSAAIMLTGEKPKPNSGRINS